MKLSVVVPAFQARSTIVACLEALISAADLEDEIIVVDDGSTDSTDLLVATVADHRVRLVRSSVNIGRGPARNLGAAEAVGDVIVFVDADVVVHRNALDLVRRYFEEDNVVAVIGSYDDAPAHPGPVSQFRNLLHHFTHHTAGETSSHFWTGLGAVRARLFNEVGQFNERRWSRNMEDVQFGHRITAAGFEIRVAPEIQGTHLRAYSLTSMIRSDLLDRAIPWTRLTLADRRTDSFVLSGPRTLAAFCAFALLPSILATALHWAALPVVALVVLGFALPNFHFWRQVRRLRGLRFLLFAIPLTYVHAIIAVVGFGAGVLSASADFLREHFGIRGHNEQTSRAHRQGDLVDWER